MKIGVENLGTIKKGEVDFSKNLIVFTGGNNQGKSYMTYLIYGYYKMHNSSDRTNDLFKEYLSIFTKKLREHDILKKYTETYRIRINLQQIYLDNREVLNEIENETLLSLVNQIFADNDIQPKISFNVHYSSERIQNPLRDFDYKDFFLYFAHNPETIKKTLPKQFQLKDKIKPFVIDERSALIFVPKMINNFLFFPAERTAIHLLSKDVFKDKAIERDEIARRVQRGEDLENIVRDLKDRGTFIPRYPLAISDYLYFANDLAHITSQPETDFADLADELEDILGGKVSVSSFGDIQFKPKRKRKKLPLHLSSSLVKSLSGLAIYLRHLAKYEDVIIIDEPELNLHPENQVLIARFLAKLANRDFKVIFSTHSDYILKELSNLVIMSNDFQAKDSLTEKYGYDKAQFLNPNKVSVYAFQKNTIENVPVTKEGISIDKIEKAIADLSQRSDDIYYSFEEESVEVA